jgi:hypothetical protein
MDFDSIFVVAPTDMFCLVALVDFNATILI